MWEPRRSIRGSKRGHQRSRMILEDVDTTITSPKSTNSIPLDYVTFLFTKRLSPRSFHFSHLRWFPHPQQRDKNTADASKSQARLTMSGCHRETALSQAGQEVSGADCLTGLKLPRPSAEPHCSALIWPASAPAKRCHVSSCPAANNKLEDQKAVTIMPRKKG